MLLVDAPFTAETSRAARNIERVTLQEAAKLNTLDLAQYKKIIVATKALETIIARVTGGQTLMNADKILKHDPPHGEVEQALAPNSASTPSRCIRDATKHTIAEAVEQTFKVTVTPREHPRYRGKNKKSRARPPDHDIRLARSAIVTLKAGDKIELV